MISTEKPAELPQLVSRAHPAFDTAPLQNSVAALLSVLEQHKLSPIDASFCHSTRTLEIRAKSLSDDNVPSVASIARAAAANDAPLSEKRYNAMQARYELIRVMPEPTVAQVFLAAAEEAKTSDTPIELPAKLAQKAKKLDPKSRRALGIVTSKPKRTISVSRAPRTINLKRVGVKSRKKRTRSLWGRAKAAVFGDEEKKEAESVARDYDAYPELFVVK